jgi:nucleotide-binding universal stress UspA family protein
MATTEAHVSGLRRLLVPIDGTEAGRRALRAGFVIAKSFSAHLDALHVGAEPTSTVPLVGEGMSGALIQDLVELAQRQADARAAAARAMFEACAEAAGVAEAHAPGGEGASAEFHQRTGREDEEVVALGRLSDLVVVARPTNDAEDSAGLAIHAALFETGGPVLVAAGEAPEPPLAAAAERFPGRVAIAWSDASEAARALRFALPVLARAEWVDVVDVVGSDSRRTDARRTDAGGSAIHGPRGARRGGVVEYLAWHGIAARPRRIEGEGGTGEALARACADADLVVMGAYTHSRLRQLILGSVTRHMLQETPMQLLMAH